MPEADPVPPAAPAETSPPDTTTSSIEPPPDVVLAEAEDNPEYDANDDEPLADEYF